MHFLIFIPAADTPAETPTQALERVGLADFIPGHEGMAHAGPKSPDDVARPGTLIAWRRPGKNDRMHVQPKEQTWIPALPNGPDGEGRGRYLVGFWNDSPPTPDDLLLPHADWGESVELNDGNRWAFPQVQKFTRELIRGENGQWQAHVMERHQRCFFQANIWLEMIQDDKPFAMAELADFVEETLKLNYRLTPEIASHLRLFDTNNILEALAAILNCSIGLKGESRDE